MKQEFKPLGRDFGICNVRLQFIYPIFVSDSDYIALNEGVKVNNELERRRKKEIVA
jgi:hypothetical protein